MGAILSWTTPAGLSGSVSFPVLLSETHDLITEVTTHPVDRGANVADHVRPELPSVALSVFVSNEPLDESPYGTKLGRIEQKELKLPPPPPFEASSLLNPAGAATSAIGGAVNALVSAAKGPTKVSVLTFPEKDFVVEIYDLLSIARQAAATFTVSTTKAAYTDMICTKLMMGRAAEDGTGATLQLEFKKILKVDVKLTNAPLPSKPRAALAKPNGPRATVTGTPAQTKKASLAFKAISGK